VKRRSTKRQALLDALPAIASISPDRTPVVPADASYREFVRRLPCVVCLVPTLGGDPCHLHTQRNAGDWIELDGRLVGNIFPACRLHHREQHSAGFERFAAARDLDMPAICQLIGSAYRRGWSADGLGAAALLRRGYSDINLDRMLTGELPC
jgi:hypothetical protein